MSQKYSFVFTGKVQEGQSEEEVMQRLAASFGMPIEKVEGIFKGRPVVVKSGLEEAAADKYLKRFSEAGAIGLVKPEKNLQAPPETSSPHPAPAVNPVSSPAAATTLPSGFWRRLFAFFIDTIIIGIPGWIIGVVFFDQLVRLGQPGRLIGFFIALAYFAVLNSNIGRGQTLGKKLLKIRVVDLQGEFISLPRSALRYAIFSLPHFCNGLYVGASNMIIGSLLAVIIFGLGGAIVYFFVFNRKNRRTVHDFAAGTIVVRAEPEGAPEFVPVWKGHYVAVAIISVALFGGLAAFLPSLVNWGPFPELLAVQKSLVQEPDTHAVMVQAGTTTFNNNSTQWFSANVITSNPNINYEETADHFAEIILTRHPDVARKDLLVINVVCGYDIGIATGWNNRSFSFPPKQWENKLGIDHL